MQKSQLGLVEQGLDAVEKWTNHVGHEAMTDFFVCVIPKMKPFLDGESLQLMEDSVKHKSGTKKKVEIIEDPHLQRIQKKILLLIGQMNSDLHYLLYPSEEEKTSLAIAWDPDRKLDFDLPLPDTHCSIYLDDLLPRIITLTLESTHRRTRVAASEVLHFLVNYMIGKEATNPNPNFSNR